MEIFGVNNDYSISRMKSRKYFIQLGGRENLNSRTHKMDVHPVKKAKSFEFEFDISPVIRQRGESQN